MRDRQSSAVGKNSHSPGCKQVRSWRMASSLALGASFRRPRNSCVVSCKRTSAFRRDATTARISEWDCAIDESERDAGGGAAGVATGKVTAKTTARNAMGFRIERFIKFPARMELELGLRRTKPLLIQPPGLGTNMLTARHNWRVRLGAERSRADSMVSRQQTARRVVFGACY
jgi:hypothetical protein